MSTHRSLKQRNLSKKSLSDPKGALGDILDVDEDITDRFRRMSSGDGLFEAEMAVEAMKRSMEEEGRRIYFYGCGATGRLSKQGSV